MAAEKRKPVIFNIENPREKVLYDFAETISNWSGFVKDNLERIAKKHGVTVPQTVHVTVPVTAPRQTEK